MNKVDTNNNNNVVLPHHNEETRSFGNGDDEPSNMNSSNQFHAIPCEQLIENRPRCTVYMDGVFDLFHIGHLEAIRHCAKLGDKVIIGITGDEDAAGYKRPPIINQDERIAIVSSLREVDFIVCPCPLVVTEQFMDELEIDLVVHGFANEDDAKRQEEFFEIPMKMEKFQRIPYYTGQSTTDILAKIQSLNNE